MNHGDVEVEGLVLSLYIFFSKVRVLKHLLDPICFEEVERRDCEFSIIKIITILKITINQTKPKWKPETLYSLASVVSAYSIRQSTKGTWV